MRVRTSAPLLLRCFVTFFNFASFVDQLVIRSCGISTPKDAPRNLESRCESWPRTCCQRAREAAVVKVGDKRDGAALNGHRQELDCREIGSRACARLPAIQTYKHTRIHKYACFKNRDTQELDCTGICIRECARMHICPVELCTHPSIRMRIRSHLTTQTHSRTPYVPTRTHTRVWDVTSAANLGTLQRYVPRSREVSITACKSAYCVVNFFCLILLFATHTYIHTYIHTCPHTCIHI
jgi:hypothetical protein